MTATATAPTAPPPASAPASLGAGVLELRGVSKTFRDFWLRPRVKAVQDIDLTVRRGEVIGLLGPNGSGKTTTIKMLLGLLNPTSGQIAVLGKRPSDVALKHKIGYLPEESNLYRFLNAEETLDFYGRLFKIPGKERGERVESLLKMVGLESARFRPVGEYSKGMQRRVGLAQALINDPDLLVLDEPTTGMDPIATRQIKDLILNLKARGKTILLCTHLLGEVEDVCDRLVIMYGGKIRAEGTVDELLTVEDKQSIDITGGPIDEATVERIRAAVRENGRTVEAVHAPRQRLERVFLDVIEKATAGGEKTTGAGVGGDLAGFLSPDRQQGDALLDSLSKPKAETIEPEKVEPAPEPVVDEAALHAMESPAAPEPVAAPAPSSTSEGAEKVPAPPSEVPTVAPAAQDDDADDDYLSDLAGKK